MVRRVRKVNIGKECSCKAGVGRIISSAHRPSVFVFLCVSKPSLFIKTPQFFLTLIAALQLQALVV